MVSSSLGSRWLAKYAEGSGRSVGDGVERVVEGGVGIVIGLSSKQVRLKATGRALLTVKRGEEECKRE